MLIYLNLISAQFTNTISSEVHWLIDYVRHPGEDLYQSYGNYGDVAILSAERQGLSASCIFTHLVFLLGMTLLVN